MQTKFDKMRARRSRWVAQPIKAQESDAWRLKAMALDGQMYVEAPEVHGCGCCEFKVGNCSRAHALGKEAFGGSCSERNVIYIKAE